VTHIAIESTGVYWKRLYKVLEGEFEIGLVNAQPIKFVRGRKTDVNDGQWLGELLQHGLVRGSFIPPIEQRDVRDLVRDGSQLIQARTGAINRVQEVLETAPIKLGSLARHVLGVSGRDRLEQLIAGQDAPAVLAPLAPGRLGEKLTELERALRGQVRAVQRTLLKLHLEDLADLNAKITALSEELDRLLVPFDQIEAIERLDAIPGVNAHIAPVIVSELGLDRTRFPRAAHAASWAGVAPRREASAGRQPSTKTRMGNPYLKTILVQAAHAARRRKDNFLDAQFRRLAARRGKQRAAVAVAHSILVIAYHMLRPGTAEVELGGDEFDKRNAQQLQRSLLKRLERLGLKVALQPAHAPCCLRLVSGEKRPCFRA